MSRRRTGIALALLALLAGCERTSQTVVIALHGLVEDRRYLEGFADSLASGIPPIHVEIFNAGPGAENSPYREALERAREVVAIPGLAAVVGQRDSRGTLVVGPIYQDAGLPLIVPNSTSRAIADIGPLVFRMVPDDAQEGAFLARVAMDGLDARRITLFHVADEFGIGIRDGTLRALEERELAPLDVVEYGPRRARCPEDFEALVEAALLRGTPEVVILGSRTRDAGCIVRLVAARAPEARFVAADGVNVGEPLTRAAGDYVDRVWAVQFWSPFQDAASTHFAEDFKARTGAPGDQGAALRWDAVRLLVKAVQEVGGDPADVAEYLRELGKERPPFRGVTGEISFGDRVRDMTVVDAMGRPVPRRGW